jgi:flavin reductase (DIM6/NTAB) family NADH-FMN oxidoreductase RutF
MASDLQAQYQDIPTSEALDLIPTGLFIVTAAHEGQDNWQFVQRGLGITAGPPTIVLVALNPGNRTTELVEASGEFGFMICSKEQGERVRTISRLSGHNVEDKFAEAGLVRLPATQISAPLIADAFATMECRVVAKYPAGDRTLYVGEVLTMGHDPTTEPTVHYVKQIFRFLQDPAIG